MPFFQVTITLKTKVVHSGIREHSGDLDTAYLAFKVLSHQACGESNIMHFDCYQISTYSDEIKTYLKNRGKTGKTKYAPLPEDDFGLGPLTPNDRVPKREKTAHGGGKYRDAKTDRERADKGRTLGARQNNNDEKSS